MVMRAVGMGNSHVRFYDVTSWSYVNLDNPKSKKAQLNSGSKVWAHLAAIECNGQEISRTHLATIGCNGF